MISKKVSFKKIGLSFFSFGVICYIFSEVIGNILIGIGAVILAIALLRGE